MNCRPRRSPAMPLIALGLCLTFSIRPVSAGVYDDTAAWWHLNYDPDYSPGASNVAVINDIRDQRDWGTATAKGATGKHVTSVTGADGGPQWTNAPVVCPASGQRYEGLSLYFRPSTNASGAIWPDAARISNFRLGGSSAITTRFRWDGVSCTNKTSCWIYNNSLDWTNYKGWEFGVRDTSGTNSTVSTNRLTIYVGRNGYTMSAGDIKPGKWCDAAAVLTDNGPSNTDTIELFVWPEGGNLTYQKITTSAVTNEVGAYGGIMGSEGYYTSYEANISQSGKCFTGIINHIALWGRALSYAEVLEAFCYPQMPFQIGIKNGSNTDLRIENEAAPEYTLGDPWHTMRRAVTSSNREAIIKVPLTALQAGIGYGFHVNTLTPSDTQVGLSLIVNNITNKTQTAKAGSDNLCWYVGTNQLVAGTNTLTLRYEGGTSSFTSFDWLEMGASWQIGTDNGFTTDFSREDMAPNDFYVTDPDWTHVERAVSGGTETNTVLHFFLSPEMASRFRFTYSTRVINQGKNIGITNEPPYPFCIGVNGRILYQTAGVPNSTLVRLPFDSTDLRSGENTVNLMYTGPAGCWIGFDFHRLETAPWPGGTLLLMR